MRKLTEKEMLESEIPSTKELVLERQLKQLAAENRKLKSEKYDDEAICDALKDGIKALPKTKGKYIPQRRQRERLNMILAYLRAVWPPPCRRRLKLPK